MTTAGTPLTLRCEQATVEFEGLKALDGVDLELEQGSILGLIGTNGAGKTTLVNVISGYQPPTGGSVWLGDEEVTGWQPDKLARTGVVRTFQNGRLFPALTVFENVEVAGLSTGMRKKEASERAWALLDRTGLSKRAAAPAGGLPHGDVRKVSILRALATRPRFILVDEPAAGSNEAESEELIELLSWISSEFTIGLLVIEHDMTLIMRLCPLIQVLDHGRTIALGPPNVVRADEDVLRAYLGTAASA